MPRPPDHAVAMRLVRAFATGLCDDVGLRFLRELRDAEARGVRVRLLLDDFYTTGQDQLLADFASHPHVELRLFNPLPSRAGSSAQRVLAWLHEFRRINHRMHNKLFVADNALAVTGGRNGADEAVTRDEPGATALSRIWLWLLSTFVGEDLL